MPAIDYMMPMASAHLLLAGYEMKISHQEGDVSTELKVLKRMPVTVPSIVEKITDLVEPILDEVGYELVDVEYLSKYGKWVLRVYIDKKGGITIDDCVQVNKELGDLIDIKEIMEHEYVLEVSSPGVNRPLKKEKDFSRAIGRKIKVATIAPFNGRRNFTGYLKEFRNQNLYLEVNGKQVILPWEEIGRANIVYEFK